MTQGYDGNTTSKAKKIAVIRFLVIAAAAAVVVVVAVLVVVLVVVVVVLAFHEGHRKQLYNSLAGVLYETLKTP